MKEPIQIRTGGLKCDNKSCDWKDTTIPFEEFPNWVNASCPKCGENVLSVKDFENVVRMNTVVSLFNSMTEDQLKAFGIHSDSETKKPSTLTLDFKDGNIQIL